MRTARLQPVDRKTVRAADIPLQPASYDIWDKKYRLKSKDGRSLDETIDGTYQRIARALAEVEASPEKREQWGERFLWALRHGAIPAGRIVSNAGALEHKPATSTINCLAGETPVLTRQGIRPIRDLAGQTVEILNGNGRWAEVPFKSFGRQPVYKLYFKWADQDKPVVVRATKDHRWFLTDGRVVTTEFWLTGNIPTKYRSVPHLFVPDFELDTDEYDAGLLHGAVYGDGTKPEEGYYHLTLCGDKRELTSLFAALLDKKATALDIAGVPCDRFNFGWDRDLKSLPKFTEVSLSYLRGFFAGILATDGSVYCRELDTGTRASQIAVYGDKKLIDFLESEMPYIGILPTYKRKSAQRGDVTNYGTRNRDLWTLGIHSATVREEDVLRARHRDNLVVTSNGSRRTRIWTLVAIDPHPEIEEVFCCHELETTAFAIFNGMKTGQCTVSGTIRDSMDDILRKVHEAGLTLKAGCGVGYCFSTLRPRGAYVSGAGAYTSGPLSFMDIYDKMCFTVSSAGGRRGAQMATFDIRHPDIEEFIRAKREDGRLRQFNLSLLITDEFIRAVQADADWPLIFPLLSSEVHDGGHRVVYADWTPFPGDGYQADETGRVLCRVYKVMKARRLWDLIMSSTYDYAEPGFILIDKVNEMNNNWWCEDIRASNPCVTVDTWVHTAEGPRQVRDLIGQSFLARVDGKDYATGSQGFFKTATKSVVRLQTMEGYSLRLTADHRVRRVKSFTRYTTETEWCAAGDLRPGDRVLLNDHRANADWSGPYSVGEGYLIGLLMGDGVLKADMAVLSVWKTPAAVNEDGRNDYGAQAVMDAAFQATRDLPHRSDFRGWLEVRGRGEYRMALAALTALARELGMRPGHKAVTPEMERASSDFYRGFLRGFFDADGSVQGSQKKGVSVRLAQSDLGRLEAVQRMLLRLGIASRIYRDRRPAGKRSLPDGRGGHAESPIKPQHELIISGTNLYEFAERIGFAHSEKQARLDHALDSYRRALNHERFTAVVKDVAAEGIEDVYDVQIPGLNAFDANGIHAHNCGEQMLPGHGACLLGSVNLTKFVLDPFTPEARFDWDTYREVVAVFTRMLDNVVEINGLPLEAQRNEILSKRRHGMGYLGLGSTLTMLGMRYGSPESLAFTEEVTKEMALTGWRAALDLAREKGPAPILEQAFTITAEMLRQRPELARDGYKEGDVVKGRVLHARYSRYMQRIAEAEPELVGELAEVGARFTHHSSIAPTGTISLSIANNASNGIEPSFAHHYSRNVIREGRKTKEKIDVFSFELLAYRALVNPRAMPHSEDPEERLPEYFVAADEVTPKEHVDIQAAAQRWIDSSISKTANVPTDFPYEAFKDIYLYAYEQGLKGCTTFRFNPEAFQGVLVKEQDLENTIYRFTLEDGTVIEAKGNEEIEYDGEVHTAANLFDAIKEGYYGKF